MRQNRATMVGITIVVICLMVVFLFLGKKLNARLSDGDARISDLVEQTAQENRRTEEISELQEYMQSPEYQEQVAKEKLGLVNDNDIIFKEADD